MNSKKRFLLLGVIFGSIALIGGGVTFAYYIAGLSGNGNNDTYKVEQTAVNLGTIKYGGVVAFQNNGMYPGEIGITSFTIEKGNQSGVGTYEIDLAGTIDAAFGNDVEISLYKSTDGSSVSFTPGSLVTTGDVAKVDTLVVGAGASKVYGPTALTNDAKIVLESVNFDTSTLADTTYYLVYHYKNNASDPQDSQMGKQFSGKVTVNLTTAGGSSGSPAVTYGASTITSLLSENPDMMALDDYGNVRYYGSNPDNYVSFNGEEWRIIGVFDIDDGEGNVEPRIKLIRNNTFGNKKWNTANSNKWGKTDTYSGSSLMLELNGDYLNSTGSYTTGGLGNVADYIEDAVWGTTGIGTVLSRNLDYTLSTNGLASHFYNYERNGYLDTSVSDAFRSWTGKVGLMYPSDYGYATSGGSTYNRAACLAKELSGWKDTYMTDCAANSWLWFGGSDTLWTLTPSASANTNVFYVFTTGVVEDGGIASFFSYAVYPVVYLKASVQITGGNGKSASVIGGEPYTLSV